MIDYNFNAALSHQKRFETEANGHCNEKDVENIHLEKESMHPSFDSESSNFTVLPKFMPRHDLSMQF